MDVLQSHGAHQNLTLVSLSTEHERTMSLLAEFEANMTSKWEQTFQRVSSLESNLAAAAAAQATMREDYDGLLDKSAEEQKQYLVVMLERHAEAMEVMTRQQNISSEQIEQLKLSWDKAQAEAESMKAKYEHSLEQTRWVVTKVTELEGLVGRLRGRDFAIRRELGLGVEGLGLCQTDESTGLPLKPGPSYFALSPDLPEAHDAGDEE